MCTATYLRTAAFWLIIHPFVWSCSGVGESKESSAPASIRPVMASLCDFIGRCPNALYPVGVKDLEECIDTIYWALTCRIVRVNDRPSGTKRVPVSFTADEAEQCAVDIQGLTCEEFECLNEGSCAASPVGSACGFLFSAFSDDDDDDGGEKGPGETCSYHDQCVSQHYCSLASYDESTEAEVCQVCVPPLPEGAQCSPHDRRLVPCGPGFSCMIQHDTGEWRCLPKRANGGDCNHPEHCQSGFCNGNAVCADPKHEGDVCSESADCIQGLVCFEGRCEPRRESGSTCAQSEHCRSFWCEPSDGLCGQRDGETCRLRSGASCRSGFCDDNSGRCAQPHPDGESCQENGHSTCASGYCDLNTLTCQPSPRRPRGEACSSKEECAEGLSCSTGNVRRCYRPCDQGSPTPCPHDQVCSYRSGSIEECLPKQADGLACEDDEECESGYCNPNDRCAQEPDIGDACVSGECLPYGYCQRGVCQSRKGPGEACSGYDSCLAPYLCLEGKCVRMNLSCEPAKTGQICTFLQFCDDQSYCDRLGTLRCLPRKDDGDECGNDEMCHIHSYCDNDGIGGKCRRLGKTNEPCTVSEQCESGLHCDTSMDSPQCKARLGEGATCDGTTPCQIELSCFRGQCVSGIASRECSSIRQCPLGTYCDHDRDRCHPFPVLGQQCEPHDDYCEGESYCSRYTRRCEAYKSAGEECDGSRWPCETHLVCGGSRPEVCMPKPGAGEECDWYRVGCAPGLHCNDARICGRRAESGEMCQNDNWDSLGSNCKEGLLCQWDSSTRSRTCVPLGSAGDECEEDSNCQPGLFCDRLVHPSVCAAPKTNGEKCTMASQCVSGMCSDTLERCIAQLECINPARP